MCKWPIGDPKAADFTFCGRAVDDHGPYCRDHHRIANPAGPAKSLEHDPTMRRILARLAAQEDIAMPGYRILAAHDVPTYGSFTVEAATPEAALAIARERLAADRDLLDDREHEGAHSLRIVTLQVGDEDPLLCDVDLDPEAPLWPGRETRAALLGSTVQLAHLIVSLGEADAYGAVLDQIAANLTLLGGAAAELAGRRADEPAERWIESVEAWAVDAR